MNQVNNNNRSSSSNLFESTVDNLVHKISKGNIL